VFKPGLTIRLSEIAPVLARADRLLVHAAHDLNRLKDIGLIANVTLFPHGLPQPLDIGRDALRRELFPGDGPVIACFGFLLPHKGLRELIQAFALVRRQHPKARLLLLNALYPVEDSQREYQACLKEIRASGLEACVTLTVDFLEESEILARLGGADVVVYPYQDTQESASGAIRLGLASRTPVACTPLPIFSDVAEITYRFHATSPEAIAEGLADLLGDTARLAALAERQADWLAAHGWPRVSRRLANLLRGVAMTPRFESIVSPRDEARSGAEVGAGLDS
jgi:glycosyltransferase involved in cell wall biosynthesis